MPMLNGHPAPGLGAMMPGWFAVPQNPVYGAGDNAKPMGKYFPTVGEMIAASFVVPQNPIIDAMRRGVGNVGKVITGSCGGSCGCGGTCGGGTSHGMGDIGENFTGAVNDTVQSVIDFATDGGTGTLVTLGAALLLWSIFSHGGQSDYREYMSKARARGRKKYPSRYRAAREAAAGLF